MRTIQEGIEPTSKRKKTDRLCGRLIIWDVDIPGDDVIMLAADYCHAKPDFSTCDGSQPPFPGTASISPSSLKPIAQRFYLRYGYLPKYFSKKPLLN